MSKKKVYKDIKKFTIKRSEWARGVARSPLDRNCLLNDKGMKCCLGFYSLACGLQPENIKNFGSPSEVTDYEGKIWDTFLLEKSNFGESRSNDSEICNDLIAVNDGLSTDKFKEEQIVDIFATQDIKVKFID